MNNNKKKAALPVSGFNKEKVAASMDEKIASWQFGKWGIGLSIVGSIASVIGIGLAIYFGFPGPSNLPGESVEVKTSFGDSKIEVSGSGSNANVDQSINKNNSSSVINAGNLLINSTASFTTNSANQTPSPNKNEDKTAFQPGISKRSKDNSDNVVDQKDEVPAVKLSPKKVAINSPEIYRIIRSQEISGSAFDLQQLTWQLNKLKELGQTLDFSNSSQGILMAREWIEVCSVLAGQTDVWMSKNFYNPASSRNFFDGAKISSDQSNELEFTKSLISLKIQTLKTISDVFAKNASKVQEIRRSRTTYGVKINQPDRVDPN